MKAKSEHFEQLSAYLDGEISAAEAGRLVEALSADAELAAELERLRKVRRLLHDLPRQRASDDFVARVLERAERTRLIRQSPVAAAPRAGLRWVRYLATAAVLLMVVGVGAIIVHVFSVRPIEQGGDTAKAPAPAGRAESASEVAAKTDHGDFVTKGGDVESKDLADGLAVGEKERPGDEKLATSGSVNEAGRDSGVAKLGKTGVEGSGAAPSNGGWAGKGFYASNTATSYSGDMNAPPGDKEAEPLRGKAGALAIAGGTVDQPRGGRTLGDNDAEVLFASATNEEIDSDDLVAARREVEHVLAGNGILVEPGNWQVTAENFTPTQELTNRAQFNRKTPQQVQIVAFVPREQLPRVQRELGELRSRQNVTQQSQIARQYAKDGRGLGGQAAAPAAKPAPAPAETATPLPAPTVDRMAKGMLAKEPSPTAEELIASAPQQGKATAEAGGPTRSAGVEAQSAPSPPPPPRPLRLPSRKSPNRLPPRRLPPCNRPRRSPKPPSPPAGPRQGARANATFSRPSRRDLRRPGRP